MKRLVNNKFNQNGFFICKKDNNGIYNKICFGKPFNFELFIKNIKLHNIIFDSGMYYDNIKLNNRLYQQWRSNNNFWNKLIIEEF